MPQGTPEYGRVPPSTLKPPTAPFRPQARRALDVHRLEAAACAEARAERRRTEAELERLQVPCEYPVSTL